MATDHEVAPLSEYVNPDEFKADVAINMTDISTEMQQQTQKYAMYAMKSIRARRQYEIAEKALEITESQLDSQHRVILKEENPKTTEVQIRSAVVTDPRYRAASMRVINARSEHGLAQAAERSFDQRRDMLLQIARDAAREQAGPLRVVANETNKSRLLELMATKAAA
jgi:hypothetical protein